MAQLRLEVAQLLERLLQRAALEHDAEVAGERLEHLEVRPVEVVDLPDAVADEDRPGDAVVPADRHDHRLADATRLDGRDETTLLVGVEHAVAGDQGLGPRPFVGLQRERLHRLDHRSGTERGPHRLVAVADGEQRDLRPLGPEHATGLGEEADDGRVHLGRAVEHAGRLVDDVEVAGRRVVLEVPAVGEEADRRRGRPGGRRSGCRATGGRPPRGRPSSS